jgi:hypothetical protein
MQLQAHLWRPNSPFFSATGRPIILISVKCTAEKLRTDTLIETKHALWPLENEAKEQFWEKN